jgi:hypothetical protein
MVEDRAGVAAEAPRQVLVGHRAVEAEPEDSEPERIGEGSRFLDRGRSAFHGSSSLTDRLTIVHQWIMFH